MLKRTSKQIKTLLDQTVENNPQILTFKHEAKAVYKPYLGTIRPPGETGGCRATKERIHRPDCYTMVVVRICALTGIFKL